MDMRRGQEGSSFFKFFFFVIFFFLGNDHQVKVIRVWLAVYQPKRPYELWPLHHTPLSSFQFQPSSTEISCRAYPVRLAHLQWILSLELGRMPAYYVDRGHLKDNFFSFFLSFISSSLLIKEFEYIKRIILFWIIFISDFFLSIKILALDWCGHKI